MKCVCVCVFSGSDPTGSGWSCQLDPAATLTSFMEFCGSEPCRTYWTLWVRTSSASPVSSGRKLHSDWLLLSGLRGAAGSRTGSEPEPCWCNCSILTLVCEGQLLQTEPQVFTIHNGTGSTGPGSGSFLTQNPTVLEQNSGPGHPNTPRPQREGRGRNETGTRTGPEPAPKLQENQDPRMFLSQQRFGSVQRGVGLQSTAREGKEKIKPNRAKTEDDSTSGTSLQNKTSINLLTHERLSVKLYVNS